MSDKSGLTSKQEKVLDFIRQKVRQNAPPTVREIARAMGFSSTGTVRDYLAALKKKGYLTLISKKSRGIELKGEFFGRIPIIASIAAGRPDFAYEDIEGFIDCDELFLGRLGQKDIFALKVKGESMVEAGILPGDTAIIKKQEAAENNQIIAALLDNNEVTLKRLKKQNANFYLEPANKNYQPIHQAFSIIGKLITVIRKY
ncbi:MAG: transcriptional repressor LexA [Candidatus Omnitrophota bacterium]|nr:transcriptional repressor LexA [Candidatus Omnitrophota bacterium]